MVRSGEIGRLGDEENGGEIDLESVLRGVLDASEDAGKTIEPDADRRSGAGIRGLVSVRPAFAIDC
jgi:hypothetical protein